MSAQTLVRSLLHSASVLLNDATPQFVRWSAAELTGYANEGQRAIATYVPTAASRVDSIKLAPGARQSIAIIPGESVLPGDGSEPEEVRGLFLLDVVCNMGASGTQPGSAVSIVQREVIDGHSLNWRRMRGVSEIEHYIYDPSTPKSFEVYPPVAAGGTWVEAKYVFDPKPIPMPEGDEYTLNGSSEATISIGDRWATDLLNYILARAWMKDAQSAANAANVQMYSGLFVNSINAQVAVLTGHNPNLKVLPLTSNVPAAAS